MRLHPDGVDDRIRAPTTGQLADHVGAGRRRCSDRSTTSMPRARARASRSGTRSTRDHPGDAGSERGDPGRHLADRTESEHDQRPAVGHGGVLDRLPGGRQHVGQVDEAVVRRAVRDLDVGGVGQRHPQVLRLAARHRAVQLGVAEQGRTAALLAHLGRLALGVEGLVAHEAVAARDLERHHHPVADRQPRHLGADLLHDSHRLVPENVTGVHEGAEGLVQVQIRSADVGGGDPHDGVARLLDPRVGHVLDATPCACPATSLLSWSPSPGPGLRLGYSDFTLYT